jgi:hypothetical protein
MAGETRFIDNGNVINGPIPYRIVRALDSRTDGYDI